MQDFLPNIAQGYFWIQSNIFFPSVYFRLYCLQKVPYVYRSYTAVQFIINYLKYIQTAFAKISDINFLTINEYQYTYLDLDPYAL